MSDEAIVGRRVIDVDGRVVEADGRVFDSRRVFDDRDKKFFVANKTDAPVNVHRNGKAYVIPVNLPVLAASKEIADEVVANNPSQLRVIEQRESGRVFLRQNDTKDVLASYNGTRFAFPYGIYVEVETKQKAEAVNGDYKPLTGAGFKIYVEGEPNPDNKKENFVVVEDSDEFIFLPKAFDMNGDPIKPEVIE